LPSVICLLILVIHRLLLASSLRVVCVVLGLHCHAAGAYRASLLVHVRQHGVIVLAHGSLKLVEIARGSISG